MTGHGISGEDDCLLLAFATLMSIGHNGPLLMPACFDPRFDILPPAQLEIWQTLAPAAPMDFALYGGTAIALQLGHRQSVDFDFFSSKALDKEALRETFPFFWNGGILQDEPNTLVVSANMPSGEVKVSFFGGFGFGRVNDPLQSTDGVLLVASIDDLMATKLQAILDRAEAKDYRDLAAMLASGADLSKALGAFKAMFRGEPRTALMAIGYFEDGDVGSISAQEKRVLIEARDRVRDLPEIALVYGSLVVEIGPCEEPSGMRP